MSKKALLLCMLVNTLMFSIKANAISADALMKDEKICKNLVVPNNFVKFPCTLNSLSKNKKITLIGQNHRNKLDDDVKNASIEGAGNGNYYLGLEGHNLDNPDNKSYWETFYKVDPQKARIFGIESPFSYQLSTAVSNYVAIYRATNNLFDEEKLLATHKMSNLINFVDNIYKIEAFKTIKRPLADKESEKLAQFIDELIIARTNKSQWMTKLQDFQKNPLWQNNQAHIFITKKVALALGKLAETKYKEKFSVPDLKSYYALLEDPKNVSKEQALVDKISVGWRNLSLAINASKLYCAANKEGKDLVINVGTQHLPGLNCLLKQASHNKIKIELIKQPEK